MSRDYSVTLDSLFPFSPLSLPRTSLPGRYMEMIEMLKPIAFDVVLCMTQLFDYYLYTVYTLFACDTVASVFCLITDTPVCI